MQPSRVDLMIEGMQMRVIRPENLFLYVNCKQFAAQSSADSQSETRDDALVSTALRSSRRLLLRKRFLFVRIARRGVNKEVHSAHALKTGL